jgi:glycosyltransferase involved in cell wall biosynthesis
MLSQIDFFIHYFKDLDGYSKFYGIGPGRSGYAAFKPNFRERFSPGPVADDYITIFGQSCRDYEVYFSAVRGLRAVMPFRDIALLRQHGSLITHVPEWVEVLDNDGSQEAAYRILSNAKLVVVPIRPDNICSSSIGTYLNAMWLGKACILTAGPGVSDVLTDQAVIVPPGDPSSLREAIQRLLEDDGLRAGYAERGRKYAESLGGVAELSLRVKDEAMLWYYARRSARRQPNK